VVGLGVATAEGAVDGEGIAMDVADVTPGDAAELPMHPAMVVESNAIESRRRIAIGGVCVR